MTEAQAISDDGPKAEALGAVALAFGQLGDKEGLSKILADAGTISYSGPSFDVLGAVAQNFHNVKNHKASLDILGNTLRAAKETGQGGFFNVLKNGIQILVEIDGSDTLKRFCDIIIEVDSWWER